ncbi:MAG: 2-phospho-L-lactate transferase CofD family protein [Acidimicrobiales bacterium]
MGPIVVLAGGVGAARFLAGLVRVVDPATVTAIVNVGDDLRLHGLHVSPDLDTVTYTLAGAINPDLGWGLAGESWQVMDELEAYGGQTWFRLGDRDLATHLYRTQRLSEGAALHEVTAEVARRWGLTVRLLPASDDPVARTSPSPTARRSTSDLLRRPPARRRRLGGALRRRGRRRRRTGGARGHRRRRARRGGTVQPDRVDRTGPGGARHRRGRARPAPARWPCPRSSPGALKGPADRLLPSSATARVRRRRGPSLRSRRLRPGHRRGRRGAPRRSTPPVSVPSWHPP